MKVSPDEVKALSSFFKNKAVLSNERDIIGAQNHLIDSVKHIVNRLDNLDLELILKLKTGLCFERSFVLQKLFDYNDIPYRPVYLFYSRNQQTDILDFFEVSTLSHAGVEIFLSGKWYYLDTNTKTRRLMTFDEFLRNSEQIPDHCFAIRHLSNRHGNFLWPGFIPDVY